MQSVKSEEQPSPRYETAHVHFHQRGQQVRGRSTFTSREATQFREQLDRREGTRTKVVYEHHVLRWHERDLSFVT